MACGIVLAVAAAVSGQQQQLPPPFPRANATLLLENDRIRVWNIVWPKGQPTAMHRHVYDQVGTYYMPGGRRITQPDGEVRTNFTEVGSLSTTKRGTTHIEEGTTDPPLRAIFVELKHEKPSPGEHMAPGGATVLSPDVGKKVLDDERVSAWDLTWKPGPQGMRYRAPAETVIVWLGDGTLTVTEPDGSRSSLAVRPGTMRHLDAGSAETLEMTAGSPRTMFFQFK
jgi:hypothetical protein